MTLMSPRSLSRRQCTAAPADGEVQADKGQAGTTVRGRSRLRRRRALLLGLVALFALPPLYMVIATPPPGLVYLPEAPSAGNATARGAISHYRIFVVGWGYHTSIIVEQPTGWRLGPPGEENAPYVEYAWGDCLFYMESNYWPHALFATVFLPTTSVVYIDGRNHPPDSGEGVYALYTCKVTATQLRAVVSEMERAVQRTTSGQRVAPYPHAAGSAGQFYPGREFYIFWSDCNAWTVRRLQAAGLAGSSALVIFEGQVWGRL
jgi:hypothetical protein